MTYLDVGIFGNELDKSFEAVQQIAGCPQQYLNYLIVFVGFHELPLVVLENNSNELDEGDEKCSKSD